MIVAIDGPSGAGKSTVAKAVAKELGFSCLDTGAMYRAIAWRALQDGVALDDEPALGAIARTYDIAFGHVEGDPVPRRVFIGDDEVTDAIRTAEIDRAVSPVSAAPAVREALLDQQRRIGNAGDYVVEGRDIGTVVFPDAAVEVLLTGLRRGARAIAACARTSTAASDRSTTTRCWPTCAAAMRPTPPAPRRPCAPPTTPCTSTPLVTTSKR